MIYCLKKNIMQISQNNNVVSLYALKIMLNACLIETVTTIKPFDINKDIYRYVKHD